jgi:formylglycine-generating enzyme required for sulfatase activity
LTRFQPDPAGATMLPYAAVHEIQRPPASGSFRAAADVIRKNSGSGLSMRLLAALACAIATGFWSSPTFAQKRGDVFKDCAKCPEMVVVPPGSFEMGSPASEEGRISDEGPRHLVKISNPFAVGRFAVTFDEWDACVADGGCNGYKPTDHWGRGRQPVINVSWEDAKGYVAWLARKTGKTYRLLSEAEREYVTRAGTTTPFWWGPSMSVTQANGDGRTPYADGPTGEYRQKTVPVDSFAPNPWGLYQVHGNVYDWVEDCWHNNYAGAPTDGSAWVSGDCSRRVLRGGSWGNVPRDLMAAIRFRDIPASEWPGRSDVSCQECSHEDQAPRPGCVWFRRVDRR